MLTSLSPTTKYDVLWIDVNESRIGSAKSMVKFRPRFSVGKFGHVILD